MKGITAKSTILLVNLIAICLILFTRQISAQEAEEDTQVVMDRDTGTI